MAVGDIQVCFEVLGEEEDPTVLLVMGLGLSMDWWRDDFWSAAYVRWN